MFSRRFLTTLRRGQTTRHWTRQTIIFYYCKLIYCCDISEGSATVKQCTKHLVLYFPVLRFAYMSCIYVYRPICCVCLFIAAILSSVLWHCWLDVRKSIRPVKIEWWGVGVVICLQQDADCFHVVQLMPLPSQTPSSLASFKSRLVLPFW